MEIDMFQVIDPKLHFSHTLLLDSYMGMIAKDPALLSLFQEYQQGTFIVMNDEARGIFGGALLEKKNRYSLQKKIRENLPSSALETKEAWACTVYLHLENENLFPEFEMFCKKFYMELYQKLVEFGMKEGIDYISVTLVPGEYLCTEALGFWPYVLEMRPSESGDSLFHGILSLLKNRPKLSVSVWDTPMSKKLAA